MLGLGVGLTDVAARRIGTGLSVPGMALVAVPSAPSARYHPHSMSVSKGGDDRILTATDIMATADATAAAGSGPREMTDARGRKYWRFRGASWLEVANLTTMNSQGFALFVVGRRLSGTSLSLGINGTTAWNQVGVARVVTATQGGTPKPYVAGTPVSSPGPFFLGQQMQVVGFLGRTTGNGGCRFALNRSIGSATQPLSSGNIAGCEIGRYSAAPANTSNPYLNGDVYDLLIYQGAGTMTNAQFDAIATALADGWSIPDITHDLVFDGDSITFGLGIAGDPTPTVYGQSMMAGLLTDPGGPFEIARSTRVTNGAVSGSGMTLSGNINPTNRRDAGDNVFVAGARFGADVPEYYIQIGVNDVLSSNAEADASVAALKAHLNTTSTGILQRGFRVVVGINISNGNASKNPVIAYYRTLLRSPAFLTDVAAGPGQTYDGRVVFADLDAITYGAAGTVFATQADAGDGAHYQGDGLHPTLLGNQLMLTGGDTPANGMRAKLL